MCFGGSASANSQANASNQTTVNVSSNTTIDTVDLAHAIEALAGSQASSAALQARATIAGQTARAQGQEIAAEIAAHAGPSASTIIIVVLTAIGVAASVGLIKFPRALRV